MTEQYFRIVWNDTETETLFVSSIDAAYHHAYDAIEADPPASIAYPVAIEAVHTGHRWYFDRHCFTGPAHTSIDGLVSLGHVTITGAPHAQLSTDDVKDIQTARLTILRHLEGYEDVDLPRAAAMLASVLQRHGLLDTSDSSNSSNASNGVPTDGGAS